MLAFFQQPWPWYVAGPLIGLMVPLLLLLGNKSLGISSSLRHVCAMCVPASIPFFTYDWKKELWNIFFVAGIALGGLLVVLFFMNPDPIALNPALIKELRGYGIQPQVSLLPGEIFSWSSLLTLKGLFLWCSVVSWLALEPGMQGDVLVAMPLWVFQIFNGLPWLQQYALWPVASLWQTLFFRFYSNYKLCFITQLQMPRKKSRQRRKARLTFHR